nr:MAG TPA: hypothetical protein [Caudoviricetes sp.]
MQWQCTEHRSGTEKHRQARQRRSTAGLREGIELRREAKAKR